jgi:hypothetical protein
LPEATKGASIRLRRHGTREPAEIPALMWRSSDSSNITRATPSSDASDRLPRAPDTQLAQRHILDIEFIIWI